MNPIMRDFLRKGDVSKPTVRRPSADAEPPAKRTKNEFGAFYRNLSERSIGTSSSGCGTGTKSTPGCADQTKRSSSRPSEGPAGRFASSVKRSTTQLIRVPDPAARKRTNLKAGEPTSCAGQSKRTLSSPPGIPAGRPSASQPTLKLPIRLSASPSGSPEGPADRLVQQRAAKFSTSPGSRIGGPARCANPAKQDSSRSPEGRNGSPAASTDQRPTKQLIRVPNPANRKGMDSKGFRVLTGEPTSCVGQSKRTLSRSPGIPAGRPSASQPTLKLPIRISASPSGSPEGPADRLDKQQSAKFSTTPGSPIGGCADQAKRTLSRPPGIPAGRPSASQPTLKLPIRLSASPSGSPEGPADRLAQQRAAKFSTSPGSPIGGCADQAKRTLPRSPEGPAGRPASSAGSRSTKQHARVPNPAAQNGTDSKAKLHHKYKQHYKAAWEKELQWLKPVDGKAHCEICDVYLKYESGGLKDLKNHAATDQHIKNATGTKISKNHKLFQFMASSNDCTDGCIRLCLYAVQKNISFKAVEELVPVLKKTCPDSKIAAGLKLHRTKVSRIMVAVTGASQKERLIAIMRACCFSIIVDESTDAATEKVLCIVVRYYDTENECTRDALYDLIHIEKGDAQTLYKAVVGSFTKDNIPYKRNLQGLATDNAKVMTGDHKSLYAYLKRDVPHLVLVRCVCHSMALCASYASKQLPSYLEQLLKDIYGYLSASPARLDQYDKIQTLLEYNPTRIPRMHDVRFLSRGQVVKAVLSRFDALQIYFGFASNVDQISNAGKIHAGLQDNITKLYLEFLNFVLPLVDGINLLFQSEQPEVITMMSTLKSKITQILGYFVIPEVLREVDLRDIKLDEENLKSPADVYLGVKVANLINSDTHYDERKLKDFHMHCALFYRELAAQMIQRFQFNTNIFEDLEILEPLNVMTRKHNSIAPLINHFQHLFPEDDWQRLDNEFNEVMSLDFAAYGLEGETNADRFWRKIITLKQLDGEFKFAGLRSLLQAVFALPHSSAAAERIFSAQNLNKTKLRSRLKNATLVGILRTKDWLKAYGNASVVHIPRSMRERMNKYMYETNKSEEEEESEETLYEILKIVDS